MITPEESIPRKSNSYLFGQSAFFRQFNDIDFYVEDEDQESLYKEILSKLIPEVRFVKVFPLNGKPNLLKHAATNSSTRKSVYLADKDFDDLLKKKIPLNNIIYLERYSIENYLVESSALMKLIISCKPRLTDQRIADKISLDNFIQDAIKEANNICLLYFLVQKGRSRNKECIIINLLFFR
jgi:hypothetical protein